MKNRIRNYNGIAHYETDSRMVYLEDGTLLSDAIKSSQICLTEATEEKMTHSDTTVFHRGVFYSLHTSDNINTVEDPINRTTKIVLSEMSMLHLGSLPIQRTVVEIGTPIGDFTQSGSRSPYDPNMYIDDNGIAWLFFIGVDSNDGDETFCLRKFDTKTSTFENSVTRCTIDGGIMNKAAMNFAHNKYRSGASGKDFNISCSIIKASDGYYYTGVGAAGTFYGMIIRSANLVDWESVAVPNTSVSAWEVELAEFEDGKLAVALRGCYFGWYNIKLGTWSTPTKINNTIGTRPHIFKYKSKWYLLCNLNGSIETTGYGTVQRATLGCYEITNEGVSLVKTIANRYGIHYAKTTTDYDGNLYIAYSSDTRRLDASQARSCIMMEKLSFD